MKFWDGFPTHFAAKNVNIKPFPLQFENFTIKFAKRKFRQSIKPLHPQAVTEIQN
jgi:hypothetical protein